jgi:hypothetical protein
MEKDTETMRQQTVFCQLNMETSQRQPMFRVYKQLPAKKDDDKPDGDIGP